MARTKEQDAARKRAERERDPEAFREKRRLRYAADPEMFWRHSIKYRYGITVADYERLYLEQDGRCAICLIPFSGRAHIDHEHETGRIRGLLCRPCNVGLGHFGDNVEGLMRAVAYLERNS